MVKINKLMFIFIAFAVNQLGSADHTKKLKLTILYESKCPDSEHFIVNQLKPTMQLLHEYVTLKFVPFGKAKSTDARGEFECQHGLSECRGNMVQDCALDIMKGRSDLEKVDYVVCEMKTMAGTTENMQCVKSSNISTMEVLKCLLSIEGARLQYESEHTTDDYRPKFIPTVIVNGKFNQRTQDHSLRDLTGTLCEMLGNVSPCQHHQNHKARFWKTLLL